MTEDNLFGLSKETMDRARDVEERRRYWEEQEAARLEQKAVAEERVELESYLTRRAEDFKRITGNAPTEAELRNWQAEHMNRNEAEQQTEQQRRHEAALQDNVF